MQVFPNVPETKTFDGQIIGFGDEHGQPIIEVLINGEEEETTYKITPDLHAEYHHLELPALATVTVSDVTVQNIIIQ